MSYKYPNDHRDESNNSDSRPVVKYTMVSSPEDENEQRQSLRNHSKQRKQKGGRKPIYNTLEERKQRNRQAQAAFRERRTEYIMQLEQTVQTHEADLQNLWAKHHTVSNECLMLRYKNSLLSRILLEKGIDIKSEMSAITAPQNQPDQILYHPAFQHAIHSTPVEALPTPLPNGYLFSSNYEIFTTRVAASSSEQIQNQGVRIQEATKVPLHDRREMGITGNNSMGGFDLPRQRLSSFESHIQQLEAEYDLDYAIDGEKLVLDSMH